MSSGNSLCVIKDSAFILEDLTMFYQDVAEVDVFINAAGSVEILAINDNAVVVDRVLVGQLRSATNRLSLRLQ